MNANTRSTDRFSKVLRALTLLGACWLLIFSLFALLPTQPAPGMDLPSHLSLQYAIAAAAGLAWSFYPLDADKWTKLIFGLCLAINLMILAPFLPLRGPDAAPQKAVPLKILQ